MEPNVVRFRFGAVIAPAGSPRPSTPGKGEKPCDADAGSLVVEERAGTELGDIAEAWDDLARRALERNVFAERPFALAAMQHLAGAQGTCAVLVWRERDAERQLAGLLLLAARRRLGAPGLLRGWHVPLSGLGTPLIDADDGGAVAAALLDHLSRRSRAGAGLVLPMLAAEGSVATALAEAARTRGLPVHMLDRHERAVLNGGQDAERLLHAGLKAKKLKDLRRQLRRLGDHGRVRIEEARDPQGVRDATEVFLGLEASGWKGARGTALVQDHGTATFVRSMTRLLAREGRCHVETLSVGEMPVAAALVLQSADQAWFWKIAYDERFARFSPGVQLTLALTHRQLAETTLTRTDSCAIADHPMIDHLWRERMAVTDLFIGLRPAGDARTWTALRLELMRRALRAAAKRAYHRLKL
ncbi:GNAT family N-acetyltransferase [Chelatococcus sp. CO-6]|uniref:GNAT family N-acetyltransferase n=1 Tax=Chelatococcus sp. CO-6 TaxID=1702325 RepID=UPI00069ED17F|nr:GNAT family N-acetyltransferase [Chelatococcus sp. CO-6]